MSDDRIEELEAKVETLRDRAVHWSLRAAELEAENKRLRRQVDQLDAYITYRDYDREILDENRRLKEKNERLCKEIESLEVDAGY